MIELGVIALAATLTTTLVVYGLSCFRAGQARTRRDMIALYLRDGHL